MAIINHWHIILHHIHIFIRPLSCQDLGSFSLKLICIGYSFPHAILLLTRSCFEYSKYWKPNLNTNLAANNFPWSA